MDSSENSLQTLKKDADALRSNLVNLLNEVNLYKDTKEAMVLLCGKLESLTTDVSNLTDKTNLAISELERINPQSIKDIKHQAEEITNSISVTNSISTQILQWVSKNYESIAEVNKTLEKSSASIVEDIRNLDSKIDQLVKKAKTVLSIFGAVIIILLILSILI